MDVLNNEDMIKKICSKLPNLSIERWCRWATEILVKGEAVKFHDLVVFFKAVAVFLANPVFYPHVIREERKVERKTEVKKQNFRI